MDLSYSMRIYKNLTEIGGKSQIEYVGIVTANRRKSLFNFISIYKYYVRHALVLHQNCQ